MKSIAIIGSGPAGLMAGLSLVEEGKYKVTILEKDASIGKRIKVSGNGRCNFFNSNLNYDKYSDIRVSQYFDLFLKVKEKAFNELGLIYYSDDENRMYPVSDSSKTIIKLFLNYFNRNNVDIRLNSEVKKIEKSGEKISLLINENYEYFDACILAIGGMSYRYDIQTKKEFMKKNKIELTKLSPSLTPIKTEKYKNKNLEGKRFKAEVKLYYKQKLIHKEKGEVLFKKDGISGIVIFNMSAYLARLHLDIYNDYYLEIDFLYDYSVETLRNILKNENFSIEENLQHLFIEEFKDELLMRSNNVETLIKLIKSFKLNVISLYPFENSQVTSGGIPLNCISEDLNLKDNNLIFPCGEILDIDGLCGGYNIAFAFASGYTIGKKVDKVLKKR